MKPSAEAKVDESSEPISKEILELKYEIFLI